MSIAEAFEAIGGEFLTSSSSIAEKLQNIKAFIFDWDGVFNNGQKGNDQGSPFSEADSMGTNMLRFSYLLKHGKTPLVFIVSGANNLTAIEFAKREHFTGIFINCKHKIEAIQKIEKDYGVTAKEMAFFFDDILDLDVSMKVQLGLCMRRSASPLFLEYVRKHQLAHYISGNEGGNHAVREACELLIGLQGNYESAIKERIAYGPVYQDYIQLRNAEELEILEP